MNEIMFFIYSLDIGGIERLTVDFANFLNGRGFHVSILICQKTGMFLEQLDPTIKIYEIGIISNFKDIILKILQLKHDENLIHFKGKVISQGEIPNLITPWVFNNKQYVLVEHSSNTFINDPNLYFSNYLMMYFSRLSYAKAKQIICVADLVKKSVDKSIFRGKNKTRVIYNFINFDEIIKKSKHSVVFEKNHKKIVCVGRLFKAKDHYTLLKAFKIVLQKESCTLYIVGDGPERNSILSMIEILNLQDSVLLIGETTNPYPYMRAANVFVLSSVYEGFPVVILEALLLGCNIVSTNCNDFIINNIKDEYGKVVEKRNPDQMANAILTVLKTEKKEKKIPEFLYDFSIEKVVKSYLNALDISF